MIKGIYLPEGARFSCQFCGRCCRNWKVPVDEETYKRLQKHDWGGKPFERSLFGDHPYRIKLRGDCCFFLDGENRCRIQREISYHAKPVVCRAFPLTILEVAGERYARLSYWCPSVTENTGKLLERQSRWIQETARRMDRRTAPLKISPEKTAPPQLMHRIHKTLLNILLEHHCPISDRMAAAAALVYNLQADDTNIEVDAGMSHILPKVELQDLTALAEKTRQRGHAGRLSPLFVLFLGQDCKNNCYSSVGKALALLLFETGLIRHHSKTMKAKASWRELMRVSFKPLIADDQLITRYLCSKLKSRRYLAGETTLVQGFNLLVAAFAIINVLARIRAFSSGRSFCEGEDIRKAIEATDLLVVEHSALYQSKLYHLLGDAALNDPNLCSNVLARLDRSGRKN